MLTIARRRLSDVLDHLLMALVLVLCRTLFEDDCADDDC